jgi:hypothetical protein
MVAVDKAWLRRMLGEVVQQEAAVGDRPAGDVGGMRRQIEAFATGAGVPAHEALARGREFLAFAGREFGKANLRARPEDVVLGNQRIDNGLLLLAQRVIGGALSANSVSPAPNGDGGGTATANSIPSTTGTGM